MRRTSALFLLALIVIAGCSPDSIDSAEWQSMTPDARLLYVRSLIGAEQVKDSKGGTGRSYARPAEQYRDEIDAAYARGDRRRVHEIFASLEPHS